MYVIAISLKVKNDYSYNHNDDINWKIIKISRIIKIFKIGASQ
jgi:hypothetical protein